MLNRDIPLQTCNAESRGKNLLQFNISIARRSVTANFCLQTFPAAIWVFAINYLKYWNYHKYRGATAYLLAPPTTFPAALVTYLSDHRPLLHRATFGRAKTRTKNWTQIGHPRYSVADTRSSYQKFCNSFKPGRSDAKNADLQDFIWRVVAKSVAVCAAAFW